MKKIFYVFAFLLCIKASAQNFTISMPDTIKYGSVNSTLGCVDTIICGNSGLYVDVIRVQNDTAPNWSTSFCLDVCFPPFVDSARVYILPNGRITFILDFYSSSLPDSSTALFKFVNPNNPANVFYQRLYGITTPASVAAVNAPAVTIHIFPMPVSSGSAFNVFISDMNNSSGELRMNVYDMCGRVCANVSGLHNGNNSILLSLPAGIYSCSILKNEVPVVKSKLVVGE